MVDIFNKKNGLARDDNMAFKDNLRSAFKVIKEEFDAHLDTINENTAEIQANYEYIQRMENKIDKLGERLDTIHMFLKKLSDVDEKLSTDDKLRIQPLSDQEKKVFMVLYTSADIPLSYFQMAEKTGMVDGLVMEYITSMIEKGLPLVKEYKGNKAFYKLDKSFRDLQAKKNVLNISQQTLKF